MISTTTHMFLLATSLALVVDMLFYFRHLHLTLHRCFSFADGCELNLSYSKIDCLLRIQMCYAKLDANDENKITCRLPVLMM